MRPRRSTRVAALLATFLGALSFALVLGPSRADAAPAPELADSLAALFARVPSASFAWSAAGGVSDRAALLLPVDLDGTEGWLQLDTGLDVTLLYGDLATKRGWETFDGMFRVPHFALGDSDLGPMWVRTRPETKPKGGTLGSLGLDLLVGAWVVIDYPGQRFAWMRPGDAPPWLQERATWSPVTLRDGKLFPYVTLGGQGVDDLFFDTGSSAFDVIVDADDWAALTGPDRNPTEVKVRSWGEDETVVGAEASGPLVVGSARIPSPRVYTMKDRPNLFAAWPFPVRGLMGNSPFFDEVVILDLGMRPRFGILR